MDTLYRTSRCVSDRVAQYINNTYYFRIMYLYCIIQNTRTWNLYYFRIISALFKYCLKIRYPIATLPYDRSLAAGCGTPATVNKKDWALQLRRDQGAGSDADRLHNIT
jgi:hypothetical protein